MNDARPARRWCLVVTAVVGVALAAAPLMFQMFSRAPKGGRMIANFRPYMTPQTISDFRGYLREIDAAKQEADAAATQVSAPSASTGSASDAIDAWREKWPTINADMSSMLTTMDRDIPRFRGVSALPPFPLFPWFFVLPGLMVAGLSIVALRTPRGAIGFRRAVAGVAIVGLGVVAAPGIFQMFTRAPGGAKMIDDFRPLMTSRQVRNVQLYFVAIGSAEAELRNQVIPSTAADGFPATRVFVADWPHIANRMAPMIGAMADNVGNYEAVDALPPFWLFPWFFVLPGALTAGMAFAARPRSALVGRVDGDEAVRDGGAAPVVETSAAR